jgi:hypothetical protein
MQGACRKVSINELGGCIDDARVEVLAKSIQKYGGDDIVLSSDWKEMRPTDDDYLYLVSKLGVYGLTKFLMIINLTFKIIRNYGNDCCLQMA